MRHCVSSIDPARSEGDMRAFMVAAALTGLAVLLLLVRSPPPDSEEKDPATILLDRSPSSIPSAAMEPVSPHQGSIPGLENLPAVTWQELVEGTPGIGFRSIEQLDDDPALMQQMQEDLENFRRYGSIGKGGSPRNSPPQLNRRRLWSPTVCRRCWRVWHSSRCCFPTCCPGK